MKTLSPIEQEMLDIVKRHERLLKIRDTLLDLGIYMMAIDIIVVIGLFVLAFLGVFGPPE